MNLERLRAETRHDHESTEAAMPLMDDKLTRESYVDVLLRLHAVVSSWERWAAANAPPDLLTVVEARRRTKLIERDLQSLGTTSNREAMFPAEQIPGLHVEEPLYRASFLGAMYVMEGSTLGGQYIARHLEKTLGFEAGAGDAYFRGYEDRTGEMWRDFKKIIVEISDEAEDIVIAAAKAMFTVFRARMLG